MDETLMAVDKERVLFRGKVLPGEAVVEIAGEAILLRARVVAAQLAGTPTSKLGSHRKGVSRHG